MQIKEIIQVYSYLFQVDASSYTINSSEGLKIGYLGWSTITGDAQRLLKSSLNEIEKDLESNFFLAENKKAVKWVSSAPVSFSGSLSQEYNSKFTELIKKSESAQIAELKFYYVIGKKYAEALNLTEPNHKILAVLRTFVDPLSYEEISIMATKEDKLSELVGNSERLSCLLSPVKRYLPGQDIDLAAKFPWLYTNKEIDES